MIKILDRYIIRKFLGTFFFSLSLIISIAVVFDISEKLEDFLGSNATLHQIVYDYYMNFIPYFANLFSPLFVFIAVIFFTAKMADNTEIVAILNSGVSFNRMLVPYFVSAAIIALLSWYLNGWVIPPANKGRLAFEEKYVQKNPYVFSGRNVHRQISPGVFVYFESFNNLENTGYRFTLEKIIKGKIRMKLSAERARWDSISSRWIFENYFIREMDGLKEHIRKGAKFDTTLTFHPSEFSKRISNIETMNNTELAEYIALEQLRGSENIPFYLTEKYRRTAAPFATFILTLIGVSLASRKVRGGIGLSLMLGLGLSFSYILFMQVAYSFATSGTGSPLLAVWTPNLIFAGIGLYLLQKAPK